MKKILIIGEYYSNNLGDAIICKVVENLFINEFETKMIDLSGKTSYINPKNSVQFNLRKESLKQKKIFLKNFLLKNNINIETQHSKHLSEKLIENFEAEYKSFNPDVILFAGGQMFMDYFIQQINYVVKKAEKDGKMVIFNACGIGNITGNKNKKAFLEIINSKCVKYISVRDGFNKIKNISKNSNLIETYDTAIFTSKFFNNNNNKLPLGLGIMYVKNQSVRKQIKFWSQVIQYCEKENLTWEAFSNGALEDQAFIEFLFKINKINNKKIYKKPNNAEDLVNTITRYESIISMRLHSLIIAYSYDIPFVAISWDKKVNAFLNKIDNSKMCLNLDANCTDIFSKLKDFNYSSDKKQQINEKINENINAIKEIINSEVE